MSESAVAPQRKAIDCTLKCEPQEISLRLKILEHQGFSGTRASGLGGKDALEGNQDTETSQEKPWALAVLSMFQLQRSPSLNWVGAGL